MQIGKGPKTLMTGNPHSNWAYTLFHKHQYRFYPMKIDTVWGVYHADGGIMGEMRYVAGVLFREIIVHFVILPTSLRGKRSR